MSISNKINDIPNKNSLSSNNINSISPINLDTNYIKQDILFFKNEVLRDIRKIEEKLFIKLNEQKMKTSEIYGNYDSKIDNISNKLSHISTLLSSNKNLSEKIAFFESFKLKTENNFIAINSKISTIQKESKDSFYHYEQIINDNLKYPGVIGNNNKFPSLRFFIDFVLDNIKILNELKEEIKKFDFNGFKKRIDLEIKNIKYDIDDNYKHAKNIIENNIKESNMKIDSYTVNLDKKLEEREEKIKNNIKECFEDYQTKINFIKDDLNDKYNKQTKEIENIKNMQKTFNYLVNNINNEKFIKSNENEFIRRRSKKMNSDIYMLKKRNLNKKDNMDIINNSIQNYSNTNKEKNKNINVIESISDTNKDNIKNIENNTIINNINNDKNTNIKDDNYNPNININEDDNIDKKNEKNEIKENTNNVINLNTYDLEKLQEKKKIKNYIKNKISENKILDLIKKDIIDNSNLNDNNFTENSINKNISKLKFKKVPLTSKELLYNKISKTTKRNSYKKINNEESNNKLNKEEYHSFDFYELNKKRQNKQDKTIEFKKKIKKLKFHASQNSQKIIFPNNYSITNIPHIQFSKIVIPEPSNITNNYSPLYKTSLSDNYFKTIKNIQPFENKEKSKNLFVKNINVNNNINKIKKIDYKLKNKSNVCLSPKENKFDSIKKIQNKNKEYFLSNNNKKEKNKPLSYDKIDKGINVVSEKGKNKYKDIFNLKYKNIYDK